MQITKLGHCCLYIEHKGMHILTDPGSFTSELELPGAVDIILITHEHGDHVHVPSVVEVLKENPKAKIITNHSVGALLEEEGIEYEVVEGTASTTVEAVQFAAFDGQHVEIFENFGQVQNTGYFIDDTLFYPGDAYTNPRELGYEGEVQILALPVAGPWCCVKDVIKYLRAVAPPHTFPVHDGLLNESGINIVHRVVANHAPETTSFHPLTDGNTLDLS